MEPSASSDGNRRGTGWPLGAAAGFLPFFSPQSVLPRRTLFISTIFKWSLIVLHGNGVLLFVSGGVLFYTRFLIFASLIVVELRGDVKYEDFPAKTDRTSRSGCRMLCWSLALLRT